MTKDYIKASLTNKIVPISKKESSTCQQKKQRDLKDDEMHSIFVSQS